MQFRLRLATASIFGLLLTTTLMAQDRTFVTSERLALGTDVHRSASVRLGDVDSDGDLDVVVANGRHWPEQNFLFLNAGKSTFSIMRPLGSDRRTSYACEFADLDGDGDLDIATGNDLAPGRIFLNDGTGTFSAHGEFSDVSSLRSLTVADIDCDGDIDLISTCRGRANRIYLNDGAADFRPGPTFGRGDDSTIDVAVADVNADGHQDLLLANRDRQANAILFGDDTLQFNQRKTFGTGNDQARAIAVADMNDDGKLDWVVGNIRQSNQLFLGDGKGGILETHSFGPADSVTYAIAVADMNNDGTIDVICGNVGQANSVFFNGGHGKSFVEASFGDPAAATYGLAVGDLDGDDYADIVVANSNSMNFVFLNRPLRTRTAH
ncbi:MAG: VCBS repeat-containing protein [Phycisphaera sp. RhM]|nr:VCBS repeat-containing protein [Phycisphaera sp. RhM]